MIKKANVNDYMKTVSIVNKISAMLKGRLHIISACRSTDKAKSSKRSVLYDQIIDSLIVGGITGLSAYIAAGQDASLKSAALAFLLTFLIKMKEYRKIK
jgi:uncharacterized membrane protein YoaK (UPF0700 family)